MMSAALNARSFGLGGCGLASCFGGGGFFSGSGLLSASAIGSSLVLSGFFSACLVSSLGLLSWTGFGGSGFFSIGFSTGLGGGCCAALVVISSFLVVIFPEESSGGVTASATLSTFGFGLSLAAVCTPAVMRVKSVAE